MNRWTELRTAAKLAKLQTLSATAEVLGIHRSTVMRHIDALEEELAIKLFQRNDKGYLPTEAGLEVMRLGEVTELRFGQFANKARNQEEMLQGTLTVTCVPEMGKILLPSIVEYQNQFPQMSVDIKGDLRNYELEYGEADLALRTGTKPTTLDNIVLPFSKVEVVLCAHKSYIERFGLPSKQSMDSHKFMALSDRPKHLGWNEWIYDNVPESQIILTSMSPQILHDALLKGLGIGMSTRHTLEATPDLVELEIGEEWIIAVWILVHRDMINIPKIRTFVDILKRNQARIEM